MAARQLLGHGKGTETGGHMTDSTAVYVFDDLHPEDNAMLQALYSRSPSSVVSHLDKVKQVGSGKFMEQFYIGYGHASIGDCGSTTIFIENVSMLVAKAIQDNPLYSGQEASTRYLDFSQQEMVDPYNHPASRKILDDWMTLYNTTMPTLIEAIKVKHPFDPADYKSEKGWEKAAQVRAFDILRSVLPVGTTTLLSWHTNLRQARDHLRYLNSHPLEEVRNVAKTIFTQLCAKYPNSFNGEELNDDSERYGARNEYAAVHAVENHVLTVDAVLDGLSPSERTQLSQGQMIVSDKLFDISGLNSREAATLGDRPRGAPMARRLMKYGSYDLKFLLDFGSFRDLQRHRNGYCPVPVIGNAFGFYSWYDSELERLLAPADYANFKAALTRQFDAIASLGSHGIKTDALTDQYLYPMGMACACELSYTLPQMVYVAELRSGTTVHASLRPIAQDMARAMESRHPTLKLYVDYSEDSWSPKRGEQDITVKATAAAVA